MSKKILVMLDRGMTSKTPLLVFEHEIPILMAIHGDESVVPFENAATGEALAADLKTFEGQIGQVFDGIAAAEYERMVELYGPHPEYKMSVVEYCYGRPNDPRWAQALFGNSGAGAARNETGPEADMTIDELRTSLKDLGVEYPPTANRMTLAKIFRENTEETQP